MSLPQCAVKNNAFVPERSYALFHWVLAACEREACVHAVCTYELYVCTYLRFIYPDTSIVERGVCMARNMRSMTFLSEDSILKQPVAYHAAPMRSRYPSLPAAAPSSTAGAAGGPCTQPRQAQVTRTIRYRMRFSRTPWGRECNDCRILLHRCIDRRQHALRMKLLLVHMQVLRAGWTGPSTAKGCSAIHSLSTKVTCRNLH